MNILPPRSTQLNNMMLNEATLKKKTLLTKTISSYFRRLRERSMKSLIQYIDFDKMMAFPKNTIPFRKAKHFDICVRQPSTTLPTSKR